MAQYFDPNGKLNTGANGADFVGASHLGSEIVPTNRSLSNGHSGLPQTFKPEGLEHYRGVPVHGVLQHAAEQLPKRAAIRYGKKTWNYQQLNHDAIRCAAMLRRLGVKPGDRVGILLPNIPEFVIAANGIWRAGGAVVAISPLMVAHEVEKFLRHTDCRFVICLDLLTNLLKRDDQKDDNQRLEKVLLVSMREQLPAHKQFGYLSLRHKSTGRWTMRSNGQRCWFWNEIHKSKAPWQQSSIETDTAPAFILPSGGTTGKPIPAMLSHQNMVANAWQQFMWTGKEFGKITMMAALPFFQCYGFSTALGGFMMGATLILHDRFDSRQVMRLIEQERPNVFHAVPSMLVAMNRQLRSKPIDMSSLRWVISGGAGLAESVGREFARHTGAIVVEGYGLSEASPVTHVGDLFAPQRFGVIGLPLPETECRVVDAETGEPVQPGEVGELLLRGPQVMLGYWNNPEATKIAIADGWLHTGDLVVCHPDGNYSIVGRKKELIITSGLNVYPSEVEDTLRNLEELADVSVVGQPDERRGEIVKAIVILKPGATWDEQKLRKHCTERLSKYKRPRIYEQCHGELPPKQIGQIVRNELTQSLNHVNGSKPPEESK